MAEKKQDPCANCGPVGLNSPLDFLWNMFQKWGGKCVQDCSIIKEILDALHTDGCFDFQTALGIKHQDGSINGDNPLGKIRKALPWPLTIFWDFVFGIIGAPLMLQSQVADSNRSAFVRLTLINSFLGALTKWTGLDLSILTSYVEKLRNYLAPQETPGQGPINLLVRNGKMQDALWECLTRLEGNCVNYQRLIVEDSRPKVPAESVLTALDRGTITEVQAIQWLTAIGYPNLNTAKLLSPTRFAYPSSGQVASALPRLSDDADTKQRYQLDEGFGKAWNTVVKTWALGSQLPMETALKSWRDSRATPSPSVVQEMLWRSIVGGGMGVDKVEQADLDYSYQVSGYSPFWAKRLQLLAVPIPSRGELIRDYTLGAIDETKLRDGLRPLGYDVENIDRIVRSAQQRRLKLLQSNPFSRLYISNSIPEEQWRAGLTAQGASDDELDQVKRLLDMRRKATLVAKCVGALHKRYVKGGLDRVQAQNLVMNQGLDGSQATDLVGEWQCELSARDVVQGVGTVVRWRKAGLITPDQMALRLARLGVAPQDAALIAAETERSILLALQTAQQKAQKANAANQAALSKRQAAAVAAAAKKAAAAAKATVAAMKDKATIQRAIDTAAEQWAKKQNKSIADAVAEINALGVSIARQGEFLPDDVAKLLPLIVKGAIQAGTNDLHAVANALILDLSDWLASHKATANGHA